MNPNTLKQTADGEPKLKFEILSSNDEVDPAYLEQLSAEVFELAQACYPNMAPENQRRVLGTIFNEFGPWPNERKLALLRDQNGALMGVCTYIDASFVLPNMENRTFHTTYIVDILVRPEYQGQHLASKILLKVTESQPDAVFAYAASAKSLHAFNNFTQDLNSSGVSYEMFPQQSGSLSAKQAKMIRGLLGATLTSYIQTNSTRVVDTDTNWPSQIRGGQFKHTPYDYEPWPQDDPFVQNILQTKNIGVPKSMQTTEILPTQSIAVCICASELLDVKI